VYDTNIKLAAKITRVTNLFFGKDERIFFTVLEKGRNTLINCYVTLKENL